MTRTETQELSEEEWGIVYAAVKEAVSHLVDFRKQEGAALEKKFREKIANIHRLLESVTPYEKENNINSMCARSYRNDDGCAHGVRRQRRR